MLSLDTKFRVQFCVDFGIDKYLSFFNKNVQKTCLIVSSIESLF